MQIKIIKKVAIILVTFLKILMIFLQYLQSAVVKIKIKISQYINNQNSMIIKNNNFKTRIMFPITYIFRQIDITLIIHLNKILIMKTIIKFRKMNQQVILIVTAII